MGRAANYAAKLTEITSDKRTWITKEVFDKLADEAKFSGNERKPMWGSFNWNTYDNRTIYGSTWMWTV